MHPNLVIQSHTKVFLFFIFYFIFRINDRQSHTKLFSVYVGLEKKSCMVQSSMDQIVPRSHHHTDISNGKVDPHGSFGIVAQFLHTWHELILTRVYEGLFYTLLVLIYTLYWQSHQGNCSTQLILLSSQFFFLKFFFRRKKHKNNQTVISITLTFYSLAIQLRLKLRKRLGVLLACKIPKQFPFIRSKSLVK